MVSRGFFGAMSSFGITNLADLQRALAAVPDALAAELKDAAFAALTQIGGDLAEYPPAPTGSDYVRTGTLGRLWTSSAPTLHGSGADFVATLGNATPYGSYVQDPDQQAWMHAGVWQTTEDVAQANATQTQDLLAAAVARAVAKLNGGA